MVRRSVLLLGDRGISPRILPRLILSILKNIKQATDSEFDITEASLAFPVDFAPEARRELCKAAVNAGIEVRALVNESTAAYIANRSECDVFERVMVLDWGGGTIDISVLRLTDTSICEISVWGDRIGGDDIDRELAERVHSRIAANCGVQGGRFNEMQPVEKDQMIMKCEEVKIALSDDGADDDEEYPLTVNHYGNYGMKSLNITEKEFNSIVEPMIKTRVFKAIDSALNRAGGLSPASIDAVLIVGGSSNLRLFERAIVKLFPKAKLLLPEKAQWSTAIGAALMQVNGGNFKLNDSVAVRLSDGSLFTILQEDHVTGEKREAVTFSLTEDAKDARFIFTDSLGENVYALISVPAKGFLRERFELTAEVGYDQIATIKIINRCLGDEEKETVLELNKLTFSYDTSLLSKTD